MLSSGKVKQKKIADTSFKSYLDLLSDKQQAYYLHLYLKT